jgi:hypothetical protein
MTDDSADSPPSEKRAADAWARSVMWVLIVLFLLASALYVFRSLLNFPGDAAKKAANVIEKSSQLLANVASAFNQGTVTTSFISYATTLSSSHYLQFATLRQTEVFTQKEEASTAFGYVPLPDLVVEARAPVEVTYYLDLSAKWDLVLKNDVIYVLAPPIKFNKPAVDASAITYEVTKGSILRDKKQALENLKQSITLMSHQRAKENTALVRETGRKQVAEFAEKWLAKSFTDGKNYPVKVFFPGEALPAEINLSHTPRD